MRARGAEAAGGGDARWEPVPEQGWVAPHLTAEFPGLGIAWITVDCSPTPRSPEPVKQRLRGLSDRFYGSHAIHLRERPIPWAYRVFFRQIGLDPDRTRTPVEQLALERLKEGAFRSTGLPADALTIAIVETGVALRAFDADRLDGPLCIHDSGPGEALRERSPADLPQGTLVIADQGGPVAALFGGEEGACAVQSDTRRVTVAAIDVGEVPRISVDEALWMSAASLDAS